MALQRIRGVLPEGGGLPDDVWNRRHNGFVALLALNAVGLAVFGAVQGYGIVHLLGEAGLVGLAGLLAWAFRSHRSLASVIATLGLMTASGILVHFSGGSIEAHFHFFVMVTIIILYQEWLPFLLAIAYVVAHHATLGLIDPHSVFNHPAAIASPVKWALIHGGFILGATIAGLTVWKQNESLRNSYQSAARQLAEAETRQRDALDLNDNVLQNLAAADYAFQLGMEDRGRAALRTSLTETQKIVSELLTTSMPSPEPGDLVRTVPTSQGEAS
jgi:signal transduction histidine kinase